MNNVKPGDMAKIVPPAAGSGAIVEVIQPASPDEYRVVNTKGFLKPGEAVWVVKSLMGVTALAYDPQHLTYRPGYAMPGTVGLCEDSVLRRIDPLADDTAEPRVADLPLPEHA